MDGNNLTSQPANFVSRGTPPVLSAALEEWQLLRDNVHGLPAMAAASAPLNTVAPVTPALAPSSGISALELLEELRTGKLTAEQAFLERTRQAMAGSAPGVFTASPTMPTPSAIPAPGLRPRAEAVTPLPSPAPAVMPTLAPAEALNAEKHLIVSLGESRYAVPMEQIVEIAELVQYTPVPNVPDWVLGITNLRGDILSLVDLNALQGEASDEIQRGSSLLVAQTRAGDLTTCIVVERVYGVMNVVPDQIQKLDQMMNHGLSAYSRGFVSEGSELVCLLEVESLLRSLEFRQ